MPEPLRRRIAEDWPCAWVGIGAGNYSAGSPAWCETYAETTSCCAGCNKDGTRTVVTDIEVERRPTPGFMQPERLWREVTDA